MRRAVICTTVVALLLLAAAGPVVAYPRRPGPPAPPPNAWQFRLGYFFPEGDSGFWEATEDVFTLDISDFDNFIIGFTYVRSVNNHFELGFNADFYREMVSSRYRGFPNSPSHDTRLELNPWTIDARYLIGGRYRIRPGRRFIIKPVYYIGAGVGVMFWRYEESGRFLFFPPGSDVPVGPPFTDRFVSRDETLELHALAGFEIPLSPATFLLFEGRYSHAEDDLRGDFSTLEQRDIDLGGFGLYGGVSFRF